MCSGGKNILLESTNGTYAELAQLKMYAWIPFEDIFGCQIFLNNASMSFQYPIIFPEKLYEVVLARLQADVTEKSLTTVSKTMQLFRRSPLIFWLHAPNHRNPTA